MKILFTICGRAGSKGIKNKNIQMFCGYPLPLYTLSAIDCYLRQHPECQADIALNTDSPELSKILCINTKLTVYLIHRKKELAGDLVAKKDVILDTLLEMEKEKNTSYEMVVDLDLTSPLRTVDNIQCLIDKMHSTQADVVFSVVPSRRSPYFNMVSKNNITNSFERIISTNYTARQEAPEVYDMNASLYTYKCSHLKKGLGALEGYNEIITMYDTGILDLDHENDLLLMQIIAEYLFLNRPEFMLIQKNIPSLLV